MTFTLPSFSYPANRTEFTNVNNMLVAFFTNLGSINPSADAGLALNLKQQNMSDTEIVNAIISQDATLQSVANKQRLEAANTLAAQSGEVAAAKAAMTAATAAHAKAPANQSDNALITVGGVTETRAQATNFGESQAGVRVHNPNDPNGALITIAEYNQIIANNKIAASSNPLLVATEPNVSHVVAINGVSVNKPQTPAESITSADATKNLLATAIKTVTSAGSDVSKVVNDALAQAAKTGADIQSTVAKALSDAGLAATNEAQTLLQNLGLAPPKTTIPAPAPAKTPASNTQTTPSAPTPAPAPANPLDQFSSYLQKLFGMQTSTQPAASAPTPAAPDILTQIETGLSSFISTAEANLVGNISKLTGAQSPATQDPTKTTLPQTPTGSGGQNLPTTIDYLIQAPNGAKREFILTSEDATYVDSAYSKYILTRKDSTTPATSKIADIDSFVSANLVGQNAPVSTTSSYLENASAFAKKYAIPIVLLVTGAAGVAVAMKLSSSKKGIMLNV
jgi:hypothetical protein